jgi:hypothetical protein
MLSFLKISLVNISTALTKEETPIYRFVCGPILSKPKSKNFSNPTSGKEKKKI